MKGKNYGFIIAPTAEDKQSSTFSSPVFPNSQNQIYDRNRMTFICCRIRANHRPTRDKWSVIKNSIDCDIVIDN